MAARIELQKPIWMGRKDPAFGIAEYKMTQDILDVAMAYRTKAGIQTFPHIYRISRAKARTFPVQVIKGTRIRVIPVREYEEVHSGTAARA